MQHKKETLLAITTMSVSLFGLISSPLMANELDYLKSQSGGGDTNILFVLDASSSIETPYELHASLVDPTSDPYHADVVRLDNIINNFTGLLQNQVDIPPSASISLDDSQCAHALVEISEGQYTNCTSYLQRWMVRKIDLIRDAVRDTLPELQGATVGFMRTAKNMDGLYNPNGTLNNLGSNGNIRSHDDINSDDNGAIPISAFKTINTLSDALTIAHNLTNSYRIPIAGTPQLQKTPISEALYEAYLYLMGERSPWTKSQSKGWTPEHLNLIDNSAYKNNNTNLEYESPLSQCSSNHIIYFTDGAPTWDWHANQYIDALVAGKSLTHPTITSNPGAPGVNGNCLSDPAEDKTAAESRLDELTGYMANYDINDQIEGKQTVKTHFVSTWPSCASSQIIDTAAAAGQGFNIQLTDINEIHQALQQLMQDILDEIQPAQGFNTTIASTTNNPFSEKDTVYVNIWEQNQGRWMGNLKKYTLSANGQLQGQNSQQLINADGVINDQAQSFWSSEIDGGSVLVGGAASHLSAIGLNRYSLIGNQIHITDPENRLVPTNTFITETTLAASSSEERDELLNWAAGADTLDLNQNSITSDIRPSLGDGLNNSPTAVHYKTGLNSEAVVFSATNEGYLHAFDADTAEHLYSFMPPEFLSSIKQLQSTTGDKAYGIDGALTHHQSVSQGSQDKHFLFFGFRRGGSSFYALDITDREAPKLAWRINSADTAFSDVGQAWSKPSFAKIMWNGSSKEVVLIGGGFDPRYDNGAITGTAVGSSLYVIDLASGQLLKRISQTQIQDLKSSIISKPIALDTNKDMLADTIVFNDLRGTVYRCDLVVEESQQLEFYCGVQAQSQSDNESLLFMGDLDVAYTQHGPYAPGTTVSLALASGNRLEPLESTQSNRLVNFLVPINDVKSRRINSIKFTDLIDTTTQNTVQSGWYFEFPNTGEKSFSQSLIVDNSIFFSTHTPTQTNGTDCGPISLGTARIYGMNLSDGSALTEPGTNPLEDQDDDSRLVWKGPARGMPQTPYLVSTTEGSTTKYALNLGIDETQVLKEVSPIQRHYWLQL